MKKILSVLAVCFLCLVAAAKNIPSPARYESFEDKVPETWTLQGGGKLSLNQWHYKLGKKSLQWDFRAGDALQVKNTVGDTMNRGGMNNVCFAAFGVWIYNENPMPGKFLRFEFRTGNKSNSYFDFSLNFKGWQSAFPEYNGWNSKFSGRVPTSVDNILIKAPADCDGRVLIDCMVYNGLQYYLINYIPRPTPWQAPVFDKAKYLRPENISEVDQQAVDRIKEVLASVNITKNDSDNKFYKMVLRNFKYLDIVEDEHGIRGVPLNLPRWHSTKILQRHAANPLLNVNDMDGIAQIYNPAPAEYNGETILLVSVVEHAGRGVGRDIGQTRLARSSDGVNFTLSDEDFITVDERIAPYCDMTHFIDNRITRIDNTYWIITPVMLTNGFEGPVGLLGKTTDFKTYEAVDVITAPKNRGASLFPSKINGKYWKLDRPGGGDDAVSADIWISSSPDLLHWGGFRPLLKCGYRFWNGKKIGPTPPVWRPEGWLVIIHGVYKPAGGTAYYLGAMLLDHDEPWRIIGRTNSYILAPETAYERHGNCDNTVFACGALPDYEKDELKVYYGAADMNICLAGGSISELTKACIDEI